MPTSSPIYNNVLTARGISTIIPSLLHRSPFERLGIDLTGPFLQSPKGNQYLLAVLDHLTGWAEAFPIPNKRSQTVWDTLYTQYFPCYGFPAVIITDQGLEFQAADFRDGLRRLGIDHKRTTPCHPQTNGAVERFHRTLKATIRKLCNNATSKWEEQLADAMWGYRVAETNSRGSSPYFLLFGHPPGVSPLGDTRFGNLARAQRHAFLCQETAKPGRQEKSKLLPLSHRHGIRIQRQLECHALHSVPLSLQQSRQYSS